MEESVCIFCSGGGDLWWEKADKLPPHERFRIVRCAECGLAWVSPRPSLEEIGRYYPQTYSWKPEQEGAESAVHRLERWYRFHNLRFETRQLMRHTDLAPGDAVLDVGCGSGDRLLVLKQMGLKPTGIEITPAADYARERLGLDVRRGTIEQVRFEPEKFQAVTLYNVIEHVHDPRSVLREVRRVLVPGGWLALQYPNVRCLQARLFGKRWAAVDVPRHLYYFSPASIERLLELERFQEISVVAKTSFLHPPTAVISIVPWSDPLRFWEAEAGGKRLKGFVARMVWAGLTLLVSPAVWLESACGRSAVCTTFARKALNPAKSR